jgi:large subunit ribosomal protein L5
MAKEKTEDKPKENPPRESAAADSQKVPAEKNPKGSPREKKPQAKPAGEKSKAKREKVEEPPEPKVTPRLYELYKREVISSLMKRFGYKNIMQVPKLEKISVNCGVGDATQDPKILETVVRDLTTIVGQKPSIRKSKKAISNFKLRENIAIGCKATLRREKMYEFMDRLISLAIPRVRDFRGVPDKSFDGRGNYTLGIKEQIIFPEIDVDKVERIFGMDVTFVTTARTDEEAYELLRGFGMPFRKREPSEGAFGKAA